MQSVVNSCMDGGVESWHSDLKECDVDMNSPTRDLAQLVFVFLNVQLFGQQVVKTGQETLKEFCVVQNQVTVSSEREQIAYIPYGGLRRRCRSQDSASDVNEHC